MANGINQHAEWLSLIEVSGPFLAEPVLKQAFPQDLDKLNPIKKQRFRQAYEEWQEAIETSDPLQEKLHQEWINWVLTQGLEWDEDDDASSLKAGSVLPENLKLELLEHNLTLKPDFALFGSDEAKPYLLVMNYPASTVLSDVTAGDGWATSPAERMSQLCRATNTYLGLVTNGEQWMLVYAPKDGITSYASWYARLWSQEPVTLNAFYSLLNITTVYNGLGAEAKQLTQLYDDSLQFQDEVTETLGAQVQRAVEVLVQSIDRINNDANGKLLDGVAPTELYEAGLTYMMRLVFMLCAEERGLLLLGDETYEANYAVSTLRMKLREEAGLHGEEVLSYRHNAWSRLLATFRAVYGGIEHETMRMPALGGSLFDPDRFPFFEGRMKGSDWRIEAARPLAIDNRTVLLFLDAIQIFQGRTLSYRALDVEQIGYVYEGLLERTVIRSPDVTLELKATKSAKKPWLLLGELANAELDGAAAVRKLLKDRTGSSASRVKNNLNKEVSEAESERLLLACQNNAALRDRIKPYFHFLRADAWGNALIYLKDAYMVAAGDDRRETGTHYTPKSLTEAIVLETLEPVVYFGPSIGTPRQAWQLKTPEELLDLKICDPAMGSGAFLVQVCRYLSERLCEAWLQAEEAGGVIILEERVADSKSTIDPLPNDAEERLLVARRLIAEHCLYGVDINPLAVELAKLAIWLVTLAKGRPFGFLDHNLRHGDSLLGITDLDQLHYLEMQPGKGSETKLFAQKIDEAIKEALNLRLQLRQQPILDINDVEVMMHLDQQSREKLELPGLVADALVGETLNAGGSKVDVTMLAVEIGQAFEGEKVSIEALRRRAKQSLNKDLPSGRRSRKALHWCLEFPEVYLGDKHGFDAVVGNPPFLGGQKITSAMGNAYRDYLVGNIASGRRGSADLVAYFFIRVNSIVTNSGFFGLIAVNTISEGNTREIGLDSILGVGSVIYRTNPNVVWAGEANVVTSSVFVSKEDWVGPKYISTACVDTISSALTQRVNWKPVKLEQCCNLVYQGTITLGEGFIVDDETYSEWQHSKDDSRAVVFDYLIGKEVNQSPSHSPGRKVINFFDWEEEKASLYESAYAYVVENVRPDRLVGKDKGARKKWWLYLRPRPELFHLLGRGEAFEKHPKGWKADIPPLERVIVFATGATKYPCFTLVPNTSIYANSLCVVASQSFALFASLSSDLHSIWAWEQGSRMKQDLRYTHGDVFETFPFPDGALTDTNEQLRELGEKFFLQRAHYMQAQDKGMTKTYNDLHDEDVRSDKVEGLRSMQIEINNAVLKAYAFEDIDLEHGFHEVGYLPEGKNLRFTISEEAREELLYRLALLNKERHELEIILSNQSGQVAQMKSYQKAQSRNFELDKVVEPKPQTDMFDAEGNSNHD